MRISSSLVIFFLFGYLCASAKETKARTNKHQVKSNAKVRKSGAHVDNKKKNKFSDLSSEERRVLEFQKKCKSAMPPNYTPKQANEFCVGVTTQEPLSCVKDSRSGSVKLTFEEALALCKGIIICI